jgi:gliding motility-associated-like protein
MKKGLAFFTCLLSFTFLYAQDFSNKGKDFWISYAGHIDATASAMGVYITSNVAASGTVTVGTVAVPFTVTANNVTRVFIGATTTPNNGAVYLSTMDGIQTASGIHVTSDKPVAVYAHIIRSARSGATLVIPVNVWGKEYIVPSYRNTGGSASFGEINVMAADTNTLVEITPAVTSRNNQHAAGVPFTIMLANPGDVYQLQFQGSADISGTKVRSIASGASGCKPIGVYSATTWSGFDCTNASGGDNLYQQLFPVSAWGKNFLTAPFATRNNDIVRVFVQDVTTVVTKTESGITTQLAGTPINGYYEYRTSQPTRISADKPISVIHYITSQTCGSAGPPPGDPEMVVLNPLEQTINNITVFSAHQNYVPTGQSVVNSCYLNIIIKTAAAPSFKINNAPPSGTFFNIPGTNYSYLQENVTAITLSNPVQTLKADSAFSAIAYGFGNVESYGYNAGTNVKDLYQHVIIRNQYASVDFPATCVNTPFSFAITLPYQATSLAWDFHGNFPNVTNNAPVPDSSYIVDAKTVYVYRLPTPYNYSTIGTYQVTVIAVNPTSDGCSGINQIDYDVEVFDKPKADFYWNHNGCLSDTVRFRDTTNGLGRPVIKWNWEFGDGSIDTVANPKKPYATSGTYNVKMSVITDVGCLADTTKTIIITPAPLARFGASVPQCLGVPVIFTDSSIIATGAIVKWYWDYGNGQKDTLTTNSPRSVTYTAAGSYTVTLQVEAAGGCKSLVFSRTIVVTQSPVASFQMPVICLPSGTGQFISTSTIPGGTPGPISYTWDFGDGGTATTANPIHQFTSAGPFFIKLIVSINGGCKDDTTQALTTLFTQPVAQFNSPAEICLGDTAQFTDQSTATNSTLVKWFWSFGDGGTDTIQNPRHKYLTAGTFTVKLVSRSAVGCLSDTLSKQIVVNALPTANFTIGTPACTAQAIIFTSTSVANSGNLNRWQWDFGDGTVLDATNGNPVSHTYNTIATYNVTLKVTSDKGCVSTIVTKPVVIGLAPIVNFGLPQVCLNDPFAEFTDSSTIANGSGGTFQYLWNFGDPNATPLNPNTSTIKNGRHRYTAAGVYTVTLTVTAANGCPATVAKQVTINGGTPVADFAIRNTGNICSSDSLIIQNQSTVNFGSVTKLEIYWDYLNNPGAKQTDNSPSPNKLYYNRYPNSTQISRQYTVRMLAYSGGVCVNEISKIVTIYSAPAAGIRINPQQVCLGDVINFEDSTANAGFTINNWSWTFGDNSNGSTRSLAHTYGLAGTYNVTLRTTTAEGCSSPLATRQVAVNPVPLVNAGPDLFVLEGGQVQIRANTSAANARNYNWSPATWLSDSSILQPVTKPLTDITYTLTVIGNGGCTGSDNVNVKVLKGLEIPNAFSPNGDGINDVWAIKSLESYPGTVIQIFDRYGRLVLNSKGYTRAWDGKMNGTALPLGTYYYIIDPKNGRPAITGSVTILR